MPYDPFSDTHYSGTYKPSHEKWDQIFGGLMKGRTGSGYMGDPDRQTGWMKTRDSDRTREEQMKLARLLESRIAGKTPSLGELQLKQGTQRAAAGASSLAASGAGINPALAARQAMQAQTQANMAANQAAAEVRMKEQARDLAQLGEVYSGMRGQDIGQATSQSQLALQGQAIKDQMVRAYMQQGLSMQQAQLQAALELERMWMQGGQFDKNLEFMKNQADRQFVSQLAGAGIGAGGALLGDVVGML